MRLIKKLLCAALAVCMLCGAAYAGAYNETQVDEYLYMSCEDLTEGQLNIMKRARQLLEIEWTPVYDVWQWGGSGVFSAGTTYTGVPYGQPVNAAYIGYNFTLSEFISAVDDAGSMFYTSYSEYNKIAPYYSIDCSGFVSYAWGLPVRKTTSTLAIVSEKIEERSLDALEVGDCLNDTYSHAALVGGILRDENGNVIAVEILEQTPNIAKHTIYGEGGTMSLDYFVNYYFGGGYSIYRYPERDTVEYTHDCAVPVDGDYCELCSDPAPTADVQTSGETKTVSLYGREGCTIYYTLDGSEPSTFSSVYTGPITFSDSANLKAIAVSGNFAASRVLNINIVLEKASAPVYSMSGGFESGGVISHGSSVTLSTATRGAQIYYTLDGSDPLLFGTLYSAPIVLSDSVTLRAVTRAEGYKTSDELVCDFTVDDISYFNDVDVGDWYAQAVNYVYTSGFFNGVGDGEFSPDGTMTRGMFITALGRMAGVPSGLSGRIGIVSGDDVNIRSGPGTGYEALGSADSGQVAEVLREEGEWYAVRVNGVEGYIRSDYLKAYNYYFDDLDIDAYYSPYVQWAYLMGITSGTGAGCFSADGDITRRDMAVLLVNYTEARGLKLSTVNERTLFTDDALLGAQAEAVYTLQQAGIINGMGDGAFSPDGSATRAQVAQIFMNYLMAVTV